MSYSLWTITFACLALALPARAVAGYAIVITDSASAIEKAAAEQLATDFQALFDASATVSTSALHEGAQVIKLGTGLIPELAAEKPGAHGLKGSAHGLLVSGNTPLATRWAASELVYRLGLRALIHGDALPVTKPALALDGLDVKLVPAVSKRVWRGYIGGPQGLDAWSEAELERLLGQVIKLKFTHLALPQAVQPFAPIAVDGDVGGRAAFKGAKTFANAEVVSIIERLAEKAEAAGLAVERYELSATNAALPVLPTTAMPALLAAMKASPDSLTLPAGITGDLNIAAHFISRVAFEPSLSPGKALSDLVMPICGEGVVERMAMGHEHMDKAIALLASHDAALAAPAPDMLLRHLKASGPPPAWLTEAKAGFASAMNEMYRANTRARGGARPFILYQAKRLEFALHHLTALESLYKAHDPATKAESLDAALESSYNSLNALADVARDASDRGVIALMNDHGYRALLKAIDEQ